MNKITVRFRQTGQEVAGWIVDYIAIHPLPKTGEATVLVAGGPSMVKPDQLPADAYAAEAWQDVEFAFEEKPGDLLMMLNRPEEEAEATETEKLHRFQCNKYWQHPGEPEPRHMGTAWTIDITDTQPAYVTALLVDTEPYNLFYWSKLLAALAAKSLSGDPSGLVQVANGEVQLDD